MDRSEHKQIMRFLSGSFPNAKALADDTIEIYWLCLKDLPFQTVKAAVLSHLAINKWFPSIAEIRESALAALPQGQIPSAGEAWEQIQRAITAVGVYGDPAERFSHSVINRTVQALGWLNLCHSENPTADRAQFKSIYNNLAARERQEALMLPEVKALIGRLAEQLGAPQAELLEPPKLNESRKLINISDGLRSLAAARRANKPPDTRVLARHDLDESAELWHIVNGKNQTLCGTAGVCDPFPVKLEWDTICGPCRTVYEQLGAEYRAEQGA